MKCKHDINIEDCAYCSGHYEQMQKIKAHRGQDDTTLRLKEQYESLKSSFHKFDELWTSEEISRVYEQLVCYNTDKVGWRRLLYITAIDLGRTINAIKWCYKHLKYPNRPYHRGEAMIRFMKEHHIYE